MYHTYYTEDNVESWKKQGCLEQRMREKRGRKLVMRWKAKEYGQNSGGKQGRTRLEWEQRVWK